MEAAGRRSPPFRAYHLTLREEADAIISRGFRDSLPSAVAGRLHKGVWLSDESEANEGDVAIESRVAGLVDLPHPPCADKTFDVENPEPHPTRQRGRDGSRLVHVGRA